MSAHDPGPAASPTVAPPAWARVRLIEGDSAANMWHVDSTIPSTQLVVGQEDGCSWRVSAPGVAPQQFEFFWDGARLWIGDTQETGGVSVDGAPFAGWQPLAGRARIEFGGAVMLAESSEPAVTVAAPAYEPAAGAGAAADDADDEPTVLAPRKDAGRARPGPAQPVVSPVDLARFEAPEPDSSPELPTKLVARFPAPSSFAKTVIEKLSDRPAPASYPGPAKTSTAAASPASFAGATPSSPAPAARPGPGIAAPQAASYAHFASTPPLQSKAPARAAAALRSVPPRTWLLGGITVAALALVLLMGGDGDAAGEAKGGAPVEDEVVAKAGSTESKADAPLTGDASDPVVTAGDSAAATVVEPLDDTATAGDDSAAAAAGDDNAAAGDDASGDNAAAGDEASDDTAATGDTTADNTAATGDTTADTAAAGDTAADEERAASLLLAGRRSDALAIYGELAERHPDRPVFAAIVLILERELAERCDDPRSQACND